MADDYDNPTLIIGSDAEKELNRAKKIMGAAWVAEVRLVVPRVANLCSTSVLG